MPNDAIVVGFDGTVGSHAALFAAVNLAHATHRPVVVVHVVRIQPIVAAGTSMAAGAGAMVEAEEAQADVCRRNCADILDATDGGCQMDCVSGSGPYPDWRTH
jgi:nucleotide-binding universal stress UspA family protein